MDILSIPSPNCSLGRGGNTVDKIVIHWMDGRLVDADARFLIDGSTRPWKGVSAHFGVEDLAIHQYVKIANTAWHANNFRVNQQSVGIEFSADPYRLASDATYETGGELIASICKQLGITPSRSLLHPHKEYSATECCGAMDLDRLAERALHYYAASIGDVQLPSPTPPNATTTSFQVPVTFQVMIDAPNGSANFRSSPYIKDVYDSQGKRISTNAVISYPNGNIIDCSETVTGELVTMKWDNGHKITSDKWYKSSLHHLLISATVAKHL